MSEIKDKIICPKCGTECDASSKFCIRCGENVQEGNYKTGAKSNINKKIIVIISIVVTMILIMTIIILIVFVKKYIGQNNKELVGETIGKETGTSISISTVNPSEKETELTTERQTEEPTENKEECFVYYLNYYPSQEKNWLELADIYEKQTGVKVNVVTTPSGEYETTLMNEMVKDKAPTLFQVNGYTGLENWKDYCYDLSETDLYEELTSDAYALNDDEKVLGIGYTIETYGIITNKTLLDKAGYKVEDIKSLDDLKKVSEDITARSKELGFSAFTSSGLSEYHDWRFKTHLANLPIYFEYKDEEINYTDSIKGTYLDNYRDIFDLYIHNSTCDGTELSYKTVEDSRTEFLNSEAVFYQNGAWEYLSLSQVYSDDELAMIPIYIGVGDEANQGLCTGTENYWCINKEADEADIKATLEFVYWCVTSEIGTKIMAEDMGFTIPFSNAFESDNVFYSQDSLYMSQGKKPVTWTFTTMPSEEWKNAVGEALVEYAAVPTDNNWKLVEEAFVQGWANQSRKRLPRRF